MRFNSTALVSMLVVLLLLSAFLPSLSAGETKNVETGNDSRASATRSADWGQVEVITRTIEIPPGEKYYVLFDNDEKTLEEGTHAYLIENLPQAAIDAINKVPDWLKVNLTRKFVELDAAHRTTYGNLINGVTNPLHVDEVAFAIAHTGKAALQNSRVYPDMFKVNAEFIYVNDQSLKYVNITEVNDPELGPYTTLTYTNRTGAQLTLPMEIYYWFVVHPKLSDELPSFVNPDGVQGSATEFRPPPTGKFWREWLFHFNDSGYPLLKDRLEDANDYWEAVAAVSGWVVGSMSFTSDNERAIEPVRIYRKHIGRCGEHQDMACAAARASLIPTICTSNSAEDHVWNEFWDGRWVHWDSNSYNNVDRPWSQDKDYRGGKNISSVWSWRGDGHVWQVSDRYTPTCNFTATVQDSNGLPVDDADIWVCTEGFYAPHGITLTTWGSTNSEGKAYIELGNERNFWFSAESSLGEDPADQGGGETVTQVISIAQIGGSYSHTFTLPGAIPVPTYLSRPNDPRPQGSYKMNISLNVTDAADSGVNLYTGNKFYNRDLPGRKIDFFMCNQSNFDKYGSDVLFDAYEVHDNARAENIPFVLPKDENWYAVLSNEDSLATSKLVNITIELYQRPDVGVISPSDNSVHGLNDIITIQGVARSPFELTNVEIGIDGDDWIPATDTSEGAEDHWSTWEYQWNTEGAGLGKHNIKVRSTDTNSFLISQINVTLEDVTSPEVSITAPGNNSQFKVGMSVEIQGNAFDNVLVTSVEMMIQNNPTVNITTQLVGKNWTYTWDTLHSFPGPYTISVRVKDIAGNIRLKVINIVLLENVEPIIEITSPENNTVYAFDEDIRIEGTALDSSGVEVVEAIVDGDEEEVVNLTRNYRNNEWYFKLDSDDYALAEGVHIISFRARDTASNIGRVAITIHIDDSVPVATILSPGNNSVFSSSEVIPFGGNVSDNYVLGDLKLIISYGFLHMEYDITAYLEEDGNWEYNFNPEDGNVTPLSSGVYSAWIKIMDSVDHEGLSEPIEIIIDGMPPEVGIDDDVPQPILIGEKVWINGTADDDVGIVKIELTVDGEKADDITASFTDGKWSHLWDTRDQNSGFTNVTVRAYDIKGRITLEKLMLEIISKKTDTDGDEMEDWWEIAHGLDRESDDRGKDLDRDGHNNWAEYIGESDPNDKRSVPKDDGKGKDKEKKTGDVLMALGIILGAILVIGVAVIIIVIVVKRRNRKQFEETAYSMWKDPKLDAHKDKERFKYDEEEKPISGSEGADTHGHGPGEEEPVELKIEGLPSLDAATDTGPAAGGSRVAGSQENTDIGETAAIKGPQDREQRILPSHLKGEGQGGKDPICQQCGTSSIYYPEHECFWCDNCMDYVSDKAGGGDGDGSARGNAPTTSGVSSHPEETAPLPITEPRKKAVVRRKVVKKTITKQ